MPLGIHIVTQFLAIEPVRVWELLQQEHPLMLTGTHTCLCGDDECSLDEVAATIHKRGKPHFSVSLKDNLLCEFRYAHVRNFDHSLLSFGNCLADTREADSWIIPFTTEIGFRQAWVFDINYNHWQNAEDPLEYTAVGRSCAGLPMRSNNLPAPLEQRIIDISQNPGRRVLRQAYVEAVGAIMWLGPGFWRLTGASKDDAHRQAWLQCEELSQGVLRLQVAASPFATADGKDGELQDRLRMLLFPKSG